MIERDRRRERDREEGGRRRREGVSQKTLLPSASSITPPTDQKEAIQFIELAEMLLEHSLDFLAPKMATAEFRMMKSTTHSVISKLVSSRRKSTSRESNSPREQSRPSQNHPDNQRKRSRESRSPSPPCRPLPSPVKRER